MNATRTFGTFRFTRPLSRAERVARLDKLATLLDIAFRIPFTKFRFGVDGLIGLAPGFGDVVSLIQARTAISATVTPSSAA